MLYTFRDGPDKTRFHIFLSPIYLIILFGLVSLAIVLKRVLNFNDCENACQELKREIETARVDLKTKGFKF
uniref:Dolichol-phosphate mannosyltransferase subunit 3 n=1 Tax=Tetranychus urticae TaxID=32264 RepID=T1KVF0_TETUR